MSSKKSALLLEYITATARASSEEDVDKLLRLMSPTDNRTEMGELYEDTLGYNPIEYFDKSDIRALVRACVNIAPDKYAVLIKAAESALVDETYYEFNKNRSKTLAVGLSSVMKELVGWAPSDINELASYEYSEIDGFEPEESEESVDDDEVDDEDDDEDSGDYGDGSYLESDNE